MTCEPSRRDVLEGFAAIAATGLLGTLPLPEKPALDLEAMAGDYSMNFIKGILRDGDYILHNGQQLPDFLDAEGRFNITKPLRFALAQIFSDGKDVIIPSPDKATAEYRRDATLISLLRRLGIPSHTKFNEMDFVRQPWDRPVLGIYGTLVDAPDDKVMLLTQDCGPWQIVRRERIALPPFSSCQLV